MSNNSDSGIIFSPYIIMDNLNLDTPTIMIPINIKTGHTWTRDEIVDYVSNNTYTKDACNLSVCPTGYGRCYGCIFETDDRFKLYIDNNYKVDVNLNKLGL